MPLEIAPGIVVDPKVRFGKPVVKGTRVPAELVVAKLAGGMTAQEVAEEYQNHPRGCARGSELRGRPPDRRRGPGDRLSVGVPGRRGHAALDGRRTAPGGAHSGRRSRCRPARHGDEEIFAQAQARGRCWSRARKASPTS
jgi:hypothetical protein